MHSKWTESLIEQLSILAFLSLGLIFPKRATETKKVFFFTHQLHFVFTKKGCLIFLMFSASRVSQPHMAYCDVAVATTPNIGISFFSWLTVMLSMKKFCLYGIKPSGRSSQYVNLLTKSVASDLINSFKVFGT